MKIHKKLLVIFLIFDAIVIIFGLLNFNSLTKRAGLPPEYRININSFTFNLKNISEGEKIIEFDGRPINRTGLLEYCLMNKNIGDTVNIKSISNNKLYERRISLPLKFDILEVLIMLGVAVFYFFTGIYILLKYRQTVFSYVIHLACISTGIMIIYDWGNLLLFNNVINLIILIIFEFGIFFVPTFFFHFSFTYPKQNTKRQFIFLVPFYFTSITLFIINLINLINIFIFEIEITNSYFLPIHTNIADIFLIIGLIMTVAKLEHSALIIKDVAIKKQIYWALLGISFGPLIFVFLRLIPRLIIGHELVSQTLMEFTTLIAPIMLLISVTRQKEYCFEK